MVCEICWESGGHHNPRCPNAEERCENDDGPDESDYLDEQRDAERLDRMLGDE